MIRTLHLPEFLQQLDSSKALRLVLDKDETAPPTLVRTLWKLDQLGLLHDQVLFSLLAQPPIDPIGLYGALRARFPDWPWTFEPSSFSIVCILAKRRDEPVALLTLDLLSDSVEFASLINGSLHGVKTVSGDEWGDNPLDQVLALAQETIARGRNDNP